MLKRCLKYTSTPNFDAASMINDRRTCLFDQFLFLFKMANTLCCISF